MHQTLGFEIEKIYCKREMVVIWFTLNGNWAKNKSLENGQQEVRETQQSVLPIIENKYKYFLKKVQKAERGVLCCGSFPFRCTGRLALYWFNVLGNSKLPT